MNFLLDRTAENWMRELGRLKAQVGECDVSTPPRATGAPSGEFVSRCGHGRLRGSLELAPTQPPRIQELELEPISP
jgi:serine-type D-Ala-D-Ala carboxypeptidase/endopeptidase